MATEASNTSSSSSSSTTAKTAEWAPPTTQELHLKESSGASGSRVKRAPDASAVPVPFEYEPSRDGIDSNLLILLHGLGDTHKPFAKLGKSLKLPQTAILAIRGAQQIPWLGEGYYQWYPSFDELGSPIVHPNPASATDLLGTLLTYLTTTCAWPLSRIHLFGFAQGGSVALELALHLWKNRTRDLKRELEGGRETDGVLGSVVSIGGPILLHHAITTPCPTPVLVEMRKSPNPLHLDDSQVASVKKFFAGARIGMLSDEGANMPASQEEWTPIMMFWSERLTKSLGGEGIYEVVSGSA